MKCPYCPAPETEVVETRDSDLDSIRRRRECTRCGKRFTTYEKLDIADLFVVKRDGRREKFDRTKLRIGIMKACEKRPVSHEKIEAAINGIEKKLREGGKNEVKTRRIGELVMEKLRELDEVAYIRFASVYRNFSDIKSFEKEIRTLKK
ncbi:MAG: transcriptional repressor NrdR [Candidatus Aenigmarchaeota archaeon]|nr:transcriptional repressor NrdR [Candidatus Aenigmarchaeota archaeon]